jgi:hypothetical protein
MDERIKELAFKAGFSLTAYEGLWEAEIADIERFAKLVRQDERDACAKVCDEYSSDKWKLYKGIEPYTGDELGCDEIHTQGQSWGADDCADAIRARKKNELHCCVIATNKMLCAA